MRNEKELVIRMDEAETELVNAVNGIMQKYELPCFLLECIIDKIHRQVINGKATELQEARSRAKEVPK